MWLVISTKGMCRSRCTRPLCCHFGWSHKAQHVGSVIGGNYHNNNGEPTIVAGPSMSCSWYAFGAAVMDNRIFVVGGYVDRGRSRSTLVESLLFQQQPQVWDRVLLLQQVPGVSMVLGHKPRWKCWISNGPLSGVFPI